MKDIVISEQTFWNDSKDYIKKDIVLNNQKLYFCIKENKNVPPTNTAYWMFLGDFVGGESINVATTMTNGISKPDGETIEIDQKGTLTAKVIKVVDVLPSDNQANENVLYIWQNSQDKFEMHKLINGELICVNTFEIPIMTSEQNGIGRPDGTTITVDENGILSAEQVIATSDTEDETVAKTYHFFQGSDENNEPKEFCAVKIPLGMYVESTVVITATGNETIDGIRSANLDEYKKYVQFNMKNSIVDRCFIAVEDIYREISASDDAPEIRIIINPDTKEISAEIASVSITKVINDPDMPLVIDGNISNNENGSGDDLGDGDSEGTDEDSESDENSEENLSIEESNYHVINARIKFREGNLKDLSEENPILLDGEIIIIKDVEQFVIGDGVSDFETLEKYNYKKTNNNGNIAEYFPGKGIIITEQNEIESKTVIFTGSHEEWDDLDNEEKDSYTIVNFIDGECGVYLYKDSEFTLIAGQMSLQYGMTTIREGTVTESVGSKESIAIEIEFDIPMPDDKYITSIELDKLFISYTITEKTQNGMSLVITNNNSTTLDVTVDWKAYKLFEVATIPDMLDSIANLQSKQLSSSISVDGVEKNTVEGVIDELSKAINNRLKIVTSMPNSPKNDDVVLYMGNDTYIYDQVQNVTNPKSENLYEYVEENYILSNDESVQIGKSYFKQNLEFVKGTFYRFDSSWIKL